MKNQKIIFILVGAFCVFALIAGIYTQFFVGNKGSDYTQNPTDNISGDSRPKTQEEIKNQLKSLFTNDFINNSTYEVQKANDSKDIVYSAYDIQKKEELYEVDIHLPVINISGDVPASFNKITQSVFADEASKILNKKYTEKVIYDVNYISYINDNILSLAIKSTLKRGNNPQREIIQTYNYNLETGEKVELVDVLTKRNIVQSECQNKINQVVSKAQEEAQILVKSGYQVYNRDLSNSIYQLSNISNFFLGSTGELYIIFAYGNQNFTAEMDVVLYE
ncbi:unknown [Clostridium sp. CAG:567]|jgi:hypothetical protein|nr:unknown [Clostridium sp. CAG:567]